ncbi:S-layer homology domain-containing protein [Paenibacillus sp. MMO-177]|uniref:S-layer homology domain-containing protein n=1 Tax=Paenibacillus sp. MMO-177 TaxID=3081289 RepID=UPI0030177983
MGKRKFGLKIKTAFAVMLIASLIAGLIPPGLGSASAAGVLPAASAAATATDISGHWAEKELAEWQSLGLINGFPDGTLRPDQVITRIEFVTLVNRLLAHKGTGNTAFSDVPGSAWYASEVQAAVQAGYINGFPDGTFRPVRPLSRVEAAVMLAKIVPVVEREGANSLDAYKDQGNIPGYGRASLEALIEHGYIQGFSDRTIRPAQQMTRAEAVTMLNRIRQQSSVGVSGGIVPAALTLTKAGTYGPESGAFTVAGDLVVNVPGITLRNLAVKGNLTIGEGVGEGEAFLDHVKVSGSTFIRGGGVNSVHLDNSELGTVVIEKKDGKIRVVVSGTTVVRQMDVKSDASVESSGGIEGITITATGEVLLSGEFAKVELAGKVSVIVSSGTVESLIVSKEGSSSAITLNDGVQVENMELHGTASVKGKGEIAKALVDAPDVRFETAPKVIEKTEHAGGSSGGGVPSGGGETPSTISVTAEATDATASGFRLLLNPAVPGLTASDIGLTDSSGAKVAIASAATLTGGSTFRIVASLKEGETYTVRLTLKGYSFGADMKFTVPDSTPEETLVTASVNGISASGFTVSLSRAVPGMTAHNFSLAKSGTGGSVGVTEAATKDEGLSYAVSASLEEGATYSLAISQSGYSFGDPATVFVPVTNSETIPVETSVGGIEKSGFTVSFESPVADLTVGDFSLTKDGGEAVAISGAVTRDEGHTYAVSAELEAGYVYTLVIEKQGYSFGAAQTFSLPSDEDVVVTATASHASVSGFLLTMDKTVSDLDALNFNLVDQDDQSISIDMLSAVVIGRQYEVWASLTKNKVYKLSLNKEGYTFSQPAEVKVEPVKIPATVGMLTHGGFKLTFSSPVYGLTADQFSLTDPSGAAVPVESFQLAANAKSAVVTADLSTAGIYAYRFETDEAKYDEGTIDVPKAIAIGKYTTFKGYSGGYTGLVVHFEQPVPDLTADAFTVTSLAGTKITLDSIATGDEGSTYELATAGLNSGGPFKLAIAADGYEFGEPATLINPTLNVWGAGHMPTQFMAGLNPNVPGLTTANFSAQDSAGNDVPILDAKYDTYYRMYIVSFGGSGGNDYTVSVHADGYDFGAPKKIHVYSQSDVSNVTTSGFTLALVPSVLINTTYGFHLTKTSGESVTIQSVKTEDQGGTYQIKANLSPGDYFLRVDADLDSNDFYVSVPAVATLSVVQISNGGLTAKLSYPVNYLDANSFSLTNTDTGEAVSIASAITDDQGGSYRLIANLSAGHYNLKLNGHLPEEGVDLQVGDLIHAGAATVSNVSTAGFDLAFENGIAGLLPANLDLRDEQNNKIGGMKLTTNDNGLTYRVSAALSANTNYTLSLQKDYVVFDSSIAFRVKPVIKGTVTDVTNNGRLILRFSPAFPEIENYLGLSITDPDGQVIMPNYFESSDSGASYEIGVPNNGLRPGLTYTIRLNHDSYAMEPVSFTLPGLLSVTEATSWGLKISFETPTAGLTKANFIVKSSSGETYTMSSVATNDGGSTYTIAGKLTEGKMYTLQYKPNDLKMSVDPVPFAVTKTVTATLSAISAGGMKVTFSSKVPELQLLQLGIAKGGVEYPTDYYSLKTTDGGLSYQVAFKGLYPGNDYTLNLAREEYRLASPISFTIPSDRTLKLHSTTETQIIIDASVTGLTADQFALYDSKGQKVAVTVSQNDSSTAFYVLTGTFDINQTYTLKVTHPDYTFAPLTVGFKIEVSAFVFGSQNGFKLLLWPGVEGLEPSDFTVTDDRGGTVAVTSVQTADSGWTYYAKAPLASGKNYRVAIADKGPYTFKFASNQSISLSTNGVSVDQLTLKGFRMIFNKPVYLYAGDMRLVDENGQEVNIRSFYSSDGGLSFYLDAALEADKNYMLRFDKIGYDFGGNISLSVRSVKTTFEGMESGNNNAFTLSFDQAVPDLKPSDFTIKRNGQKAPLPVLNATTGDGGYTYRIESSFWGSETVTVLPSKNGYDFGGAVQILVPTIVRPIVLRTGANYVDIGFNPSVLGLQTKDFIVRDGDGQTLALTSAASYDGGQSYRLAGPFIGGGTYTIALSHAGYDFGREKLTAKLARAVTIEMAEIGESGMTILLNPGIEGLSATSFSLRDNSHQSVSIQGIEELNDGKAYRIRAKLTPGLTYSVTASAAGFEFGSSASAKVPIPVTFSYDRVSTDGLTVNFGNMAIPLPESSFKLIDEKGRSVPVDSAASINGGSGYVLKAALPYGHTYSLSIAAVGYDFGAGLAFYVKEPASVSARNAMQTGFTLSFDHAVNHLTAANLSLKNVTHGNPVVIQSLTTSDNGLTYKAIAGLTVGETYTLAISSSTVDFGSALEIKPQTMIAVALSGIGTTGFDVTFSEPVPNLQNMETLLVSGDGTVNPVRWIAQLNSNNTRYQAQVELAYGVEYTLTIEGKDRAFEVPVKFVMPIDATSKVTGVSDSGISIETSRKEIELTPTDVELLTSDGDSVRVSAVIPGKEAGTFTIKAALAQGKTYSLRINKYAYHFGAATNVYIPYQVSAKVVSIHEGGLTISLSKPVAGLDVKLISSANGSDYAGKVTAIDDGLTYVIEAALSYNKSFSLKLSKPGYEFGADLAVNNASSPPQVTTAVTSADGKSITLTFDKQLSWTEWRSVFSVKINSQWQSSVLSVLGTDKKQIVLTWDGKVIDENSTVTVASSSVNRVYAVNLTYMAPFEEIGVTNVATLMGMIQSYAYREDLEYPASYPAKVLHEQYGLTPSEAARKLLEGGFKSVGLYRAVIKEYQLDGPQVAALLYSMNAGTSTVYDVYRTIYPYGFDGATAVAEWRGAGYSALEYGPVLQQMGFSSRNAVLALKKAGTSANDAAQILRSIFNETSGGSAALMKTVNYKPSEIAAGVKTAYGLDVPYTVQAMADGGLAVGDIAAVAQSLYGQDAVSNANLLSRAGFNASAIGSALAELYSYGNDREALDVFLGAGFSVTDSYAILRNEYPREAIASGLLDRGYPAKQVGGAVRSAADGAGVMISVMKMKGSSDAEIAQLVKDIWLSSGTSLSNILTEFAGNGYTYEQRAALLREQFDADVATAVSAIDSSLNYSTRSSIYKYMLAGGYDPSELMFYFMKNGVNDFEVYRQFRQAGVSTVDALQSVYNAKLRSGAAFGLKDAMEVVLSDYSRPASASEAISALRTVFAKDDSVKLDAVTLAAVSANYWTKIDIAKAIKDQLGMTLKDFVNLEGSNGFSKFGCPCSAVTAVRDSFYLFPGLTIQDITTALSMSSAYSLRDVVDANFELNYSQYGRDKNAASPYVLSALKNSGYAFEDIAAEFDRLGLNNWIVAFNKNGIAAGDVAAYLKSKAVTAADAIVRLAPYPLKDRALVLREVYGLGSADAIATLLAKANEDDEDIGRAVAWAYGGNAIQLWIQTLRVQGGTATSVMNTILARYPSYRDAGTIGPILIGAGFSPDEVMEGMITIAYRYYGVIQLKDTIRVLQSLYSQQQVSIAQLLKSASLTTPESGIEFLSYAGYKMSDIAGSLKNYYGLTAGEASTLLVKKYPNDKKEIIALLANLYGQNLSATMAEMLEAAGITTGESALDYLRYEGFGIQELAALFKDRFDWTVGQTAWAFSQRNMGGTKNVLVTAVAAVYELPVEKVIYELLLSSGTNTYAGAISFIYQAPFSLATSVKVAKDGYGVSSGEALNALLSTSYYSQSDVVAAVADGYGTPQRTSIVDSLKSKGFDTLASAVTFLGQMGFGLNDAVRVGKDYYGLTAGDTAAALSGFYNSDDIQIAVASVYGQTMTQTMLDTLTAMGKPNYSDGILEMLKLQYALPDIVLAGRDYYSLSAGDATYALLESKKFTTANVLAAVAEYYGKPITESTETLLRKSGITGIGDAALLLRSMGYSLQDVAEISMTYYGNSSQATIDALTALGSENKEIIEWTVRNVYGQASGGASNSLTPAEALEEAGITEWNAAIDYLWNARYSVLEIARFLKEFHGKSAAEAAGMLLANPLLDRTAVLYSMNGVYGAAYDGTMIDAFKKAGVFDSADTAAQMLGNSGYRMSYIAETMKMSYGKTYAETQEILAGLGLYSASAIEKTIAQVYGSVSASSGTLKQLLDLYRITAKESAVTFLKEQGVKVLDIVQYLKDVYDLDADEAMELLVPYYPGSDLGLAVIQVYYSDNSIYYVTQVISGDGATPSTVVNAMKGKFTNVQLALALKVMFRLDALGITDAMTSGGIAAEAVRSAVTNVFGADPLFAYLKRMKDNGKTAYDIAVELNQRGLLEANPAGYLVDLLQQLGYDNGTILQVRYLYYNTGLLNEGTESEQGTQLAQLGVTSPKDIVLVLNKWNMLAYKVFNIVKTANPNATTEEIALAMKDYGYWSVPNIMGGISAIGEKPSLLASKFKRMGLTAREAMNYANDLPYEDMVRNLVANGYQITDYFQYLSISGSSKAGAVIEVLREGGYSASDLAKLMSRYKNMDYYWIAQYLYDGGFTSISEVGKALMAANCYPRWLIYYMDQVADWTIEGIAKELHDSGVLSLVELVDPIQYANGNRWDNTYSILRENSKQERTAYYDALDSVSRKFLNDNDIALIVMASTLRYANVSLTNVAEQLLYTEHERDLLTAIKVMVYAGFNLGDVLETMWDVYRDVIGFTILKVMVAKTASSFIPDFKQYYDMATRLYRIVNLTVKIVDVNT